MDRSHRPHLLAFTGYAGVGKSTMARGLFPDYVRVSLAEPIRTMLIAAGLLSQDDLQHKERPVEWLGGATPRRMMQTLGTEWGRDTIYRGIWIALAERTIRAKLKMGIDVVVDDLRFNDEAEMLHRLGAVVVHLSREGVRPPNDHSSEAGIDRKWVDRVVHTTALSTPELAVEHIRELVYSFGGQSPEKPENS